MKTRVIAMLLGGVLMLAAGLARADLCADPVSTGSGQVKGLAEAKTATCVWRGIPYAAAPVGELRWKAPQPVKWEGVRPADNFGARCMQKGMMEAVNADPSGRMSEDCLFLNIWRPKKEGKFPVMVWIHGGGYTGGTGNSDMYWGDRLSANGDVVVVSINYRLGVFGFMASPELRKEDPHQSTGNYGSLDQAAAIKWVHDNVAGFGGDPGNVTIFGESAGGWSVCTMTATPLNQDLFQKAILESGGCESSEPLEAGYDREKAAAAKVGCSSGDLACLRKVPAKKLLDKVMGGLMEGFGWINHHDGYLITGTPLSMIRAGNFNRVPLLAGFNRNEVDAVLGLIAKDVSKGKPDQYESGLQQLLGLTTAEARRVAELYPLSQFGNQVKPAAGKIATDMALACPTYLGLDAVAKQGLPTYLYRFDFDEMRFGSIIHAVHAMEIPFVFDSLDRAPTNLLYGGKKTKVAAPLVKIIQGYWLNFAKTGDPNSAGLPAWPKFDPAAPQIQVLDTQVRTEPAGMADRCGFWDEYSKTHPPIFKTMGKPQGEVKK